MAAKQERRNFQESFKQQLVKLHNNGKPRAEIMRKYGLAGSVFDRWVQRINATGSSHEKANRTPEQAELILLRKENRQLRMENDILKQGALILGQK
jgi:transposase